MSNNSEHGKKEFLDSVRYAIYRGWSKDIKTVVVPNRCLEVLKVIAETNKRTLIEIRDELNYRGFKVEGAKYLSDNYLRAMLSKLHEAQLIWKERDGRVVKYFPIY